MQLKSGFSVERKYYIYNVSISLPPSNEETLNNIRTEDIKQQWQKEIHCFSDMQLKLGFSIEKKCYIYNISITLSPSLYLHIYSGVPWRRVGGGGWGAGNIKRCYTPFHFSEPYQIYAKYFRKNFPIAVLSVNRDSPKKQLSFFLSDLSILWQCKGILSSKQNHKFKHTKAASTKPLGWIKFIFSNPTFLVSAHHCIYMYI